MRIATFQINFQVLVFNHSSSSAKAKAVNPVRENRPIDRRLFSCLELPKLRCCPSLKRSAIHVIPIFLNDILYIYQILTLAQCTLALHCIQTKCCGPLNYNCIGRVTAIPLGRNINLGEWLNVYGFSWIFYLGYLNILYLYD